MPARPPVWRQVVRRLLPAVARVGWSVTHHARLGRRMAEPPRGVVLPDRCSPSINLSTWDGHTKQKRAMIYHPTGLARRHAAIAGADERGAFAGCNTDLAGTTGWQYFSRNPEETVYKWFGPLAQW